MCFIILYLFTYLLVLYMFRIFYSLLIVILSVVGVQAQDQNLASLSSGDIVTFSPLLKEGLLYGYIALYDLGSKSENIKKFEYVVLDKNLNKFASKEFETEAIVAYYSMYLNHKEEVMLNPRVNNTYYKNINKVVWPRSKKIILSKNEIVNHDWLCYEDNKFVACPEDKTFKDLKKENKKEIKEKGFSLVSSVSELKSGGYFVYEYEKHKKGFDFEHLNQRYIKFDENKKEVWRLKFPFEESLKSEETKEIINLDENYLYCLCYNYKGLYVSKYKYLKMEVIGLKDGVVKKTIPLDVEKFSFAVISHFLEEEGNIRDFDNKLVMNFMNCKELIGAGYRKHLGYDRIVIDKKNLEVDFKSFTWEKDGAKFMDVNKNGVIDGYSLTPRDYFFMEDGSIALLFDKAKPGSFGAAFVKSDMVLVTTDKDFKIKEVKIFDKKKERDGPDEYLFSQYINNKKDVVFYYEDTKKEKENDVKDKVTYLYINTIIDGQYNQETIKMASKNEKYFVSPYPAKDGYILLREYNEKEKYNQIRLEKLNY